MQLEIYNYGQSHRRTVPRSCKGSSSQLSFLFALLASAVKVMCCFPRRVLCTCIAALKDSVTNQYFPRPYVQAGWLYQYVIIGLFANNLLTQKVERTWALPLKEKNNLENLQLPLIKERQQRHCCSVMYHDTCICYLRTRIQHADYPRDDVGVRVLFDHQNIAD